MGSRKQALASSENTKNNDFFPFYKPGRPVERRFIFFVTLIFASGIYIIQKAGLGQTKYDPVTAGIVIMASLWVLHIFLVLRKEKGDEFFLPLASFLIVIGWLEIYRLYPDLAYKQMFWVLIAELVFVLWFFIVRDYRVLDRFKYLFLVLAIVLQVGVAIFGREVNGAKIWFDLGFFSIQPVEIIKLFLTFFLVSYLKQNRQMLEKPFTGEDGGTVVRYYALLFCLWGIAEIILIIEKDLGMALLLFGVFMGLFYVTTRRVFLTAIGLGLFGGASFILYRIFTHVQTRVDMWLNPWSDPEGRGYQMIQSLFAFANGGILGAGLGGGSPYFIPAVSTDFIYAAISEEFGLIGALILLSVFLVLMQRMFFSSIYAKDDFGMLLAAGMSLLFATQVFIIIGGVVKFIPLTGITLPFVSYGGSSLVSNFILMALFLQMSGKINADNSGGSANE